MLYEFEAEDGTRIARSMPVADAPPLGTVIEHEGRQYRRVASAGIHTTKVWRSYISSRLPRNMPGVKCTPEGKPIIETQAQEREVASRLGWERE